MKRALISLLLMAIAGMSYAIPATSTNVSIVSVETTVVTNRTPVNLEIVDVQYVFKTDFYRLSLLYTIDGEVVANGFALIKPNGADKYDITYHIISTQQRATITVDRSLLDARGFSAVSLLIKGMASELGGAIADMAAGN
jgi:hypothetical protein